VLGKRYVTFFLCCFVFRRAVIGNSPNIYKTLLRPFVEVDDQGSGLMDFRTFHDVLKDLGVLLTHQDVMRVAKHYARDSARPESAYPTSNLNHLQSFRDAKLTGSLRGAAKANPVVGDWLASSGVGLRDPDDIYGDRHGTYGATLTSIDYNVFVTDLSEIMIRLLERDGGVVVGTRFPWILKEYEFVDALICQLEEMKPTQRRKVLMSLQYALSAADPKQVSKFCREGSVCVCMWCRWNGVTRFHPFDVTNTATTHRHRHFQLHAILSDVGLLSTL
jgi:hypothetical protein